MIARLLGAIRYRAGAAPSLSLFVPLERFGFAPFAHFASRERSYGSMLRERGAHVLGEALSGEVAVVRAGAKPFVTDGPRYRSGRTTS